MHGTRIFSAFTKSPFSCSLWSTRLTCWTCSWREEENIICHPGRHTVYELIDHVSQLVINECLVNRGGVGQPEGHNKIFKVPPGGIKRGFPLIPLPYADQMISMRKSNLVKTDAPCNRSKLKTSTARVSILYRDVVQPSVVNARSQGTILLPHKKKSCPAGEEEDEWARLLENQKYISPWLPFRSRKRV